MSDTQTLGHSSNNQILFYGAGWCGDCHRSRQLLKELGVTYTYIDIETSPAAAQRVLDINSGNRSIPTIIFPDGTHLTEPSNALLAAKLQDLKIIPSHP